MCSKTIEFVFGDIEVYRIKSYSPFFTETEVIFNMRDRRIFCVIYECGPFFASISVRILTVI